ncbi:MAG: DUF4179 domain-containing protein, partial [Ardenticatenaceae bacterium]
MEEQVIRQVLQVIESERVPESANLWPAIQAKAVTRHRRSRSIPLPHTRPGWALLVLLVCFFVGGTAYAMSSVISQLFRMERGLAVIDISALYHEVGQTQTIDGVTVTLARAYADANRIVIAYTVESQDGQQYDVGDVTLKNEAGHEFAQMYAMGMEQAEVLSFDATPVQGTPEQLSLRLSQNFRGRFPTPDATAAVTEDAGGTGAPESAIAELQPVTRGAVQGTYRFEFTVPFIAGNSVTVQETVEQELAAVRICPLDAAGCPDTEQVRDVAVRLEDVVVTPSGTTATLCLEQPERWSEELSFIASVQPSSGATVGVSAGQAIERAACELLFFLGASSDGPTPWTLT